MDNDNLLFFSVTILFAFFVITYAYLKRKIDFSAIIATSFIGLIFIFMVDIEWLYLLIGFFIFGNLVTKYKYKIKEEEGVAEGVRTFRNVFGNGGAAAIFAIFYFLMDRNPIFYFGILGAMATASADTFATEIGQAHEKKPKLITNMKRVKVGTPGAVSLPGIFGSLLGAFLISAIPLIFSQPLDFLFFGTISGISGCITDSLFGATIERKKVDKHMTNFFATLSGGIIAMLLFLFSCNLINILC